MLQAGHYVRIVDGMDDCKSYIGERGIVLRTFKSRAYPGETIVVVNLHTAGVVRGFRRHDVAHA